MSQLSKVRRSHHAATFLLLFSVLTVHAGRLLAEAQANADPALSNLAWSTNSTGPVRFTSVHGRRAAVFG